MLPILLFAGILFATPRMMAALQQAHAALTRAPLPITGIARNAVERPPADRPMWSQTAAAHGSILMLGRGSSQQTLPDRAPQTRPMRAASLQSFPPPRIDDSPAAQANLPIAADATDYSRPPERLAVTVRTDAPDRSFALAAAVPGAQPYLRQPEALVETVPVAAADLTVVAAASAPPLAPFTQPFTRPPEGLLAVPPPQISGSVAAIAAAVSPQPAPPYVGDVPVSAQQICRVSPGLVGARSGLSTIVPRRDATLSDDPVRFGLALAAAAKAQTHDLVIYNPAYMTIAYPRGDVPMQFGVCTDVIIRAYRALDIDLQELVHISKGGASDPNIDHRRTETLRRFFSTYGESRGISAYVEDYLPGDIVTYYRPQNKSSTAHIALVSDVMAPSGRPMIVHNRGWGVQLEDALFVDQMTGHYRFFGIRPPSTTPVELVAAARMQPAQAIPTPAALPMALGLTSGINRPLRPAGARGTIAMRSAARGGMAGGRMGLGGGTPAASRCDLGSGTRSCRPGAS